MSRDQNAGRSHRMKTDNSSIERVEEFKYLGTTLTNKLDRCEGSQKHNLYVDYPPTYLVCLHNGDDTP